MADDLEHFIEIVRINPHGYMYLFITLTFPQLTISPCNNELVKLMILLFQGIARLLTKLTNVYKHQILKQDNRTFRIMVLE